LNGLTAYLSYLAAYQWAGKYRDHVSPRLESELPSYTSGKNCQRNLRAKISSRLIYSCCCIAITVFMLDVVRLIDWICATIPSGIEQATLSIAAGCHLLISGVSGLLESSSSHQLRYIEIRTPSFIPRAYPRGFCPSPSLCINSSSMYHRL